jgi:hypothetical protein
MSFHEWGKVAKREEGHILYSNVNQFINAAVERAYQEEKAKVPESN